LDPANLTPTKGRAPPATGSNPRPASPNGWLKKPAVVGHSFGGLLAQIRRIVEGGVAY